MAIEFVCRHCQQVHRGIPAYHADRPYQYWDVPAEKRETDIFLTSDSCVIAEKFYFIRGCIEIPVLDTGETFTWGVWVSLREENFFLWQQHYEAELRSHVGKFFGWLCTKLPIYPDTLLLKASVCLRDHGIRPLVQLEPTAHPLTIEQHNGITLDRVMDIIHSIEHASPV